MAVITFRLFQWKNENIEKLLCVDYMKVSLYLNIKVLGLLFLSAFFVIFFWLNSFLNYRVIMENIVLRIHFFLSYSRFLINT